MKIIVVLELTKTCIDIDLVVLVVKNIESIMTQVLVWEQKSSFILVNTREFSRAPSIDESTLYISSV